jgi:GDP-fucose transporter C1
MTPPLRVALAVSFYTVVSVSVVLINKLVLNRNLPFPITLTFAQFVVSLALTPLLFRAVGSEPAPFSLRTCLSLAPLSAISVTMIVLNNICLHYVNASFYMVARSLHVLFSILFGYLLTGQGVSPRVLLACVGITVGFALGCVGESTASEFSVFGTAMGVVSTVFVALNGHEIKKNLGKVGNNEWELSRYNSVNSVVMLPAVILATGELRGVALDTLWEQLFSLPVLFSGLLGFLINLAAYIQVKATSPLTHMVSGTFKGVIQTVVASFIFGNPLTGTFVVGSAIVVVCSVAYGLLKFQEQKSQKAK